MKKKDIFLIIILIILLVLVIVGIKTNYFYDLDLTVLDNIKQIRSNTLTKIMILVSELCSIPFLFIIGLIVIIRNKNKLMTKLVLFNSLGVFGLNFIIKSIFKRPRPFSYMLIDENYYSLPSSHTMIGICFYSIVVYIIWKHINNKQMKNILIIIVYLIILTICFSRIYLGVHYLTDVMTGMILSVIILLVEKKYLIKEEKYG